MTETCGFRFEERPDDELVELRDNHHSARVCENCLVILTIHRRIHRMKLEEIIIQMAER